MPERIWVTWEKQRRNYSMSTAVSAKLIEFDLQLPRWQRYPLLIIKTLATFFRESPKVIFAQNPSLVLALLAVLYGRLSNTLTIIDAHNAGLYPLEGRSSLLNRLARILLRWSDLTIVTNNALADYVNNSGGSAFIMPDPMPEVASSQTVPELRGVFNVLFVCSWAEDEPYLDVIKAAGNLDSNICIYITGNSRGRENALNETLPSNVILTGFIPENEYLALLNACDAVMVLTSRDDCMVCGAYEAIAAGKPLVLSGSKVLKEYFSSGCEYTSNEIDDIIRAINTLKENHATCQDEVRQLHYAKLKDNKRLLSKLESTIKDRL